MSDTYTFLSTLFAPLTGSIELRPVPATPALRDFVPINAGVYDLTRVDAYVDRTTALSINAFFGVATRRVGARSGRVEECAALPALFVDCDYKHTSEDAVVEGIATFPLLPSIVVSSGGGTHAYWLLDKALPLGNAQEVAEAGSILRRLAAAIPAADESVSEPARVLRLPGTRNFKAQYGTPRPVTLDLCEDRRYALSEICLHISDTAPSRPWQRGTNLRPSGADGGGAFRLQEVIAAGDRHSTLFALCRSQQARGLSFEAAYAACEIENRDRCECPIEASELRRFLQRAWSTESRGGL